MDVRSPLPLVLFARGLGELEQCDELIDAVRRQKAGPPHARDELRVGLAPHASHSASGQYTAVTPRPRSHSTMRSSAGASLRRCRGPLNVYANRLPNSAASSSAVMTPRRRSLSSSSLWRV